MKVYGSNWWIAGTKCWKEKRSMGTIIFQRQGLLIFDFCQLYNYICSYPVRNPSVSTWSLKETTREAVSDNCHRLYSSTQQSWSNIRDARKNICEIKIHPVIVSAKTYIPFSNPLPWIWTCNKEWNLNEEASRWRFSLKIFLLYPGRVCLISAAANSFIQWYLATYLQVSWVCRPASCAH